MLTRLFQLLLALGAAVVLIALLAVAGVLGYQNRFEQRVYPGTYVLGVDLGGMSRAEAEAAVARAFTYPSGATFTFRYNDRSWTATPADLGVQLDSAATADLAMQVGRQGTSADRLNDQGYALWYRIDLSPVVIYDTGKAQAYLGRIAAEVNQPPADAQLSVSGTEVHYTPGRSGQLVDLPATLDQIAGPVARLEGADVPLIVKPAAPALADAAAAEQTARAILAGPITLVISQPLPGDPESTWILTPDRLAEMLIVQRVDDAQGPRYLVALDANQLRAFVEPIAPLLKRDTADARYIFNDETHQLDVVAHATPGRELDLEGTLAAIQTAAPTADRRVPLAFTVTQPKYNDSVTAADLGITELLTAQTTYFLGSSAERVNNIKVAAARFVGIVVAPGEEFSFDKYLGDVSLDNGFSEALIIYNGRTIKGVGGGVCQVSTTMYRASFAAGFPTVERWPHAYRVGWYERGFGPGLDATVFAPEVDFKFKNDSATHILIEAYTNTSAGTLTFKIYGTRDRDVSMTTPVVTNVVPHPPDKYEENPALAQGEIKQVDYAVDGADVTIERTVTRNGQVLFTDRVFTRYVPWQAVFQYGPGTPVPTPEPTPTP